MIKGDLSKKLPGFKMFNAFFADLKGPFEPMVLTNKEKDAFRKAICVLGGSPKEALRPLCEDLELTAKIREARRYAGGWTFVRYEFRRLESNCTWSRSYQFMAAFDNIGNLKSYTVLCGRGEVSDGLLFGVSPRWYEWKNHDKTRDAAIALGRLKSAYELQVLRPLYKEPL